MIKGVIIDDEKGARDIIKILLQSIKGNFKVVAEADGVTTGIDAINKHQPDFIFLDIKMRDGSGFDLLKKIDHINFEVVFITAYNNYAIEAFKFSAFDYILKPFNKEDLQKIISKLEAHFSGREKNNEKKLKVLVENYDSKGQVKKLVIKNIEGFEVIEIDNIIRLEADSNYTHFYTINKRKLTASKNIGEYENLLKEHGFFRIHQSSLVNLRHIIGFQKNDGGIVKMVNGDQLKISRLKKAEFLSKFH